MGEHVTVELGHHVTIDARGWVAQRVGDDHTELTASLHDWGRLQHLTYTSLDWITRAELWCRARGYDIGESGPVLHDHYQLSAPVTILLAVADDHSTIAIVSIDDEPPTVYRDITTDEGYWYQVDSLDIVCGCGRRWNWTGDELIDADGAATTVAAVFGDTPHTPFTPCPDCAVPVDDLTDTLCPTPGVDPIRCPHCGQRCDLELAAVATYPQQRLHAVQVTEPADYPGEQSNSAFDPGNRAYLRWQQLLAEHFHVVVWSTEGTGRPGFVTLEDRDGGDAFTVAILDSVQVRDPHVLLTITVAAHLLAYGPFDGAQAAVSAAQRLARARTDIRATCPVPLHDFRQRSLPDSVWRAIPSALADVQPAPDDAPGAALILLDRVAWRVAAVGPFPGPAAAERWQPAGEPATVERLVVALQPALPADLTTAVR